MLLSFLRTSVVIKRRAFNPFLFTLPMVYSSGMNERIPELLAPAGNLSCAIRAFESGADAVYAGLSRFNAREGADNFDYDDMSKLSAYAKSRDRRFYITLNTLLKEDELDAALRQVEEIRALEPDALIVQDPGLIRLLSRFFPDIPLHASTQMGIHNSAGVEMARQLGMERVILERQVDMADLRQICSDSPLEIEVFIHGALCCSLSGMCLFSSWMGGWSGNRGRCKQPCRRRFHTEGADGKQSGFFFSTQDLYALDLISEYRKLGIASLKIEGRLKKEEYIENTVKAYRMMLDARPGEEGQRLGEAKQLLSKSYGRRWSHGFAQENDRRNLIQYRSPGVSGLLVGEVSGGGTSYIEVKLSRSLGRGDRVRIQDSSGGEASAFTVLDLRMGGRKVNRADAGKRVQISCREPQKPGSRVYKVAESRKRKLPELGNLPLHRRRRAVDLELHLDADGLHLASGEYRSSFRPDMEEAKGRPIDEAMLRELFSSTRSDDHRLGAFHAGIEGSWFIRPGELKAIRRQVWEELCRLYPPEQEEKREFCIYEDYPEAPAGPALVRPKNLKALKDALEGEEALLPLFSSESRLTELSSDIAAAVERGVRFFRLTSLSHFALLDSYGDRIHRCVSWPLPAANSQAALLYQRLGADLVQVWIELDRDGRSLLEERSPVALERFVQGRIPLLVSRAAFPFSGDIVDSRGRRFYTTGQGEEELNLIWSGEPFEDPSECCYASFSGDLLPGYGNPGPGIGEDSFNLDREWK